MKSKILKISKKQKTVRTILPQTVTEILKLKVGDYIEWTPEVIDGEIIFKIKKYVEE